MATARDLQALHQAVRAGDDGALMAWADLREESGDEDGASMLRGLPGLLRDIRGGAQTYLDFGVPLARLQVRLLHGGGGWAVSPAYFSIEDFAHFRHEKLNLPDHRGGCAESVKTLLSHWDNCHPAAEWLARRLGMATIQTLIRPHDGSGDRVSAPHPLADGALAPVPGTAVREVWLRGPRPAPTKPAP
jgi:hypothetical protein